MIGIDIICVGTLKERYWVEAQAEYLKRFTPYANVNIREVKEARPKGKGAAADAAVKEAEAESLRAAIPKDAYVIALDIGGKSFSSEAFSATIDDLATSGRSRIAFLIGGSLGLPVSFLKSADLRLSFSNMTFPHQLMRIVLLEQLYRAFKIARGETYHK